eukprot:Plantae.Rhodophyta-Hildenbrandia_rubra.ctg16427.p1 GENE.Plantae.Rhodophyta-Hildenbrandia_rubra.ctg16427~~Plantae.Rhodophyta-Hildenbrandia_rubra.ctg16427.p1  ORF type:complete len:274 (+),score=42.97 Plantae.Rhodophyta-Hildenbrandia_rubra.ctg16427:134-955(+)
MNMMVPKAKSLNGRLQDMPVLLAAVILSFFLGYQFCHTTSMSSPISSTKSSASELTIHKHPKVPLNKEQYDTVMMQPKEIDTIVQYLPRNGTYIEWGTGGSTLVFPKFVQKAYSIEHVKGWCERMESELKKRMIDNVEYHCVHAAKPGGGFYLNGYEGNYTGFRDYVDEVDRLGVQKFDFVLIDGRARVVISLKVLPYLNDDSVVAVHDTATRGSTMYSEIFNHYDLIEYVDGGGNQGVSILKRKEMYHSDRNLPISVEFLNSREDFSDKKLT